MSLVDEIPVENLKERSLQVQKKGENPDHVGFRPRVPEGKTGSAPSGILFSLCYSVFLGLRPCWGADMRGRIVNNIFFDVPADAGPVFPPAGEFSGLRPFGSVFCHLLRCFRYN